MTNRSHLFISYATEDYALADWLTRQLTARGFAVWCDRFQLLGGESFPRDIDKAIRESAFRMLALISRASLEKPNPTKERTLALQIGRERQQEFLIPLKVERFSNSELNWMLSDLTYVPFDFGWAQGLNQLLDKLNRINAPRPRATTGMDAARDSVLWRTALTTSIEALHSNAYPVVSIPPVICRFRFWRDPNPAEIDQIRQSWPLYRSKGQTNYSFFRAPGQIASTLKIEEAGAVSWRDVEKIDNIRTSDIVTSLIRASLFLKCLKRGLVLNKEGRALHFPSGLLPKNKLPYRNARDRLTYVLCAGQRTRNKIKFRYHLAPSFRVRHAILGDYSVFLRIHLYITDAEGNDVGKRTAIAHRRYLTKGWWNDKWLARSNAIVAYLAGGEPVISLGNVGTDELAISSSAFRFQAPFGIDETLLGAPEVPEDSDLRDGDYVPDSDLVAEP